MISFLNTIAARVTMRRISFVHLLCLGIAVGQCPDISEPCGRNQTQCPPLSAACVDQENLAICQALEDEGCTEILFLESCPLQFACASPTIPPSPCPNLSDACMNTENLATCQQLVDKGCKIIETMESCPLQFACGDLVKAPTCPNVTEPCMNEENIAECHALVDAGCQSLAIAKSCPVQFFCGDDASKSILCSTEAIEKSFCADKEGHAQCETLERDGCIELEIVQACPERYSCKAFHNDTNNKLVPSSSNGAIEGSRRWTLYFFTGVLAFFLY